MDVYKNWFFGRHQSSLYNYNWLAFKATSDDFDSTASHKQNLYGHERLASFVQRSETELHARKNVYCQK